MTQVRKDRRSNLTQLSQRISTWLLETEQNGPLCSRTALKAGHQYPWKSQLTSFRSMEWEDWSTDEWTLRICRIPMNNASKSWCLRALALTKEPFSSHLASAAMNIAWVVYNWRWATSKHDSSTLALYCTESYYEGGVSNRPLAE